MVSKVGRSVDSRMQPPFQRNKPEWLYKPALSKPGGHRLLRTLAEVSDALKTV